MFIVSPNFFKCILFLLQWQLQCLLSSVHKTARKPSFLKTIEDHDDVVIKNIKNTSHYSLFFRGTNRGIYIFEYFGCFTGGEDVAFSFKFFN